MYFRNKYSQKETSKDWLSLLDLPVLLILKTNSFTILPSTVSYITEEKTTRFQKAVLLIYDISLPLHRWQSILCLTYVLSLAII